MTILKSVKHDGMYRNRWLIIKCMFGTLAVAAVLSPSSIRAAEPQQARAAPEVFYGPVPKPHCRPSDRVETGLDGQLTLAERASGASLKDYSCNLEVVGQFIGEGADHQLAWQDDCAYFSTAGDTTGSNIPPMQFPGVQVIDVSDPRKPVRTDNLHDPSMMQPWESLQVNHTRKLLAGVEASHGLGRSPGFSIYDVSNCSHPRLLSSVTLPDPTISGHAGNFSVDGNTFYGTTIGVFNGFTLGVSLYAIDIKDPTKPSLIVNWKFPDGQAGLPHYITPNADGTLGYLGQLGDVSTPGKLVRSNGLVIADLSDIQFRRPNPEVRVVSKLFWQDSMVSEVPLPLTIGGNPFILITDELGAGGEVAREGAACAAKLPPFGFPRLIDVRDVKNPKIVAKLMLEADDPNNCALTINDNPNEDTYGYSAHDCGVDNPNDAKLVACSYHTAGIRVFDIHDPYHPKEIAYYKGAARGSGAILPGSALNAKKMPAYSWAQARSRFVWKGEDLYLWMTSSESGLVVAKFTNMDYIRRLHPTPDPGNQENNN